MSNSRSGKTVRLTVAQAVVTYLSQQYSVADGERRRLIPATLGIFGHGNVAGMGQALDQLWTMMPFVQGRNEQSLAHLAIGYAKATRRHATLAVTASIGPGALNLITAAGLATVNRLPVLLLPGDTYATRRQGPVLQQLQHPAEADATVNDALPPRLAVLRPDHPARAAAHRAAARHAGADRPGRHRRRGAVAAPGRPEPRVRLPGRVLRRARLGDPPPVPDPDEIEAVARLLARAQKPIIIAGGGVVYSGATAELEALAGTAGIPVLETMAGKGAVQQRAWWQIGGIGLEGHPGNNDLVRAGRLRAHRRLSAHRLPDRVAVAVREPGRAVRVDQRQRLRRPAPRRHRHRRRRQARARRPRHRGAGRRLHHPAAWQDRPARRWRSGRRSAPPHWTRTPRSTARRSRPTSATSSRTPARC